MNAQRKWHYNFGLGASLHTGNVNSCNLSNDGAVTRNDSVLAFDFQYRFLYSSLIDRNDESNLWKETNRELYFMTPQEAKKFGLIDHVVTSREELSK